MQDVDQFSVTLSQLLHVPQLQNGPASLQPIQNQNMLQKSRGKKREQANLTNEIQNDENDDDEDAEEITRNKLPQTTSPKRSK